MLGSVIPSSRFLVNRLLRQVDWAPPPSPPGVLGTAPCAGGWVGGGRGRPSGPVGGGGRPPPTCCAGGGRGAAGGQSTPPAISPVVGGGPGGPRGCGWGRGRGG